MKGISKVENRDRQPTNISNNMVNFGVVFFFEGIQCLFNQITPDNYSLLFYICVAIITCTNYRCILRALNVIAFRMVIRIIRTNRVKTSKSKNISPFEFGTQYLHTCI